MTASATSPALWGWKAIADYLGVSVDSARALAADPVLPLPLCGGDGRMVQSDRVELDRWSAARAASGNRYVRRQTQTTRQAKAPSLPLFPDED